MYGKDICRDLCLYLNLDNPNIENIKKILDRLSSTKIPDFPINGKDLLSFGIKKEHVGLHMEILKRKWFESGCLLSKKELLQKISKEFKYNL